MRFHEAVQYYLKGFGAKVTYRLVIYPRIADKINKSYGQRYINGLLEFLRTICEDIVDKYRNVPLDNVQMPGDYKIWTCWWQGEENCQTLSIPVLKALKGTLTEEKYI